MSVWACTMARASRFYGDDFTGSVDALLQFARRGWTGRLFTSRAERASTGGRRREVDVVGIAGIARSLPTAEIEAELRPALEALPRVHPHVVQYKACSTADSSPTVGSLGRVAEIGREVIAERPVPMLFAQPDFGRYTAPRRRPPQRRRRVRCWRYRGAARARRDGRRMPRRRPAGRCGPFLSTRGASRPPSSRR